MINIKKMKQKIVIKMIMTIILMVGAIIYFNTIDLSYYQSYAQNSLATSPIVLEVKAENGYVLNINESKPSKENIINLKLSNDTYTNNHYEIALKLSKDCDYQKLNVLIEKEYYNLKDLIVRKDNDYNYFLIASNDLIASQVNYEVSLFINETDVNYFNENKFVMDFVDLSLQNA